MTHILCCIAARIGDLKKENGENQALFDLSYMGNWKLHPGVFIGAVCIVKRSAIAYTAEIMFWPWLEIGRKVTGMKNFTKGLLIGVGIGMLVAPMKGEEMRRVLAERVTEWRNSLPEDSWMNQRINQVTERAADARENWRIYAQQAASKAKDTGATLGNKARLTGQEMAIKARHTGQDLADKAKQTSQDMAQKAKQTRQDMTHKAKQTAGFAGSGSDGSGTRIAPTGNE